MRKISLLIIHCTASRPNQHISVELLHKMHIAKGWKCAGYHYYCTRDGRVYQTRPEEMVGAHARHYNQHSIGICYEGGLDANGRAADTRTPAQRASLILLLKDLKQDYPDAEIVGHCELEGVHKACPSFDVSEYRNYFKHLAN